jgi:glycerol-3-phosphate acyltransferase PlsY
MNLLAVIGIGMGVAYLLGSIPFGLVIGKLAGLGDIRQIGSGNIGATNMLRTGSKKLAALTLLLDMLKGAVAVWLAAPFLPMATSRLGDAIPSPWLYAVALCAVLGHIFSFWLKGKGGKGVATVLGVLLALSPITFAMSILNWLVIFYFYRISSLAALFCALFIPLWLYIFTDLTGMVAGGFLSGILVFTHRANISRLLDGIEPRVGEKKERV